MKLIINTVNIRMGGALQRAISFIKELIDKSENQYYIFYNQEIGNQIDIHAFPENFKFYFFDNSPASLKYRHKIVKQFDKLESEIKPDLVFSFVGPAYWRPKSKHLVGYAVPHIVYSDYKYVKNYALKTKLEMIYKKFWTNYEADYWVVQTEDVKKRLARRIHVSEDKIFLVSNGAGNQYNDVSIVKKEESKIKKLLMISTYRPSKNFEIIREVIPFLKNDLFQYEFHITIQPQDYARVFSGFENVVINHGHVKAIEGPNLYNQSDAMFLPAHLECFSASYPEAMIMEKPILTSDFSFAHTVCGEAALYFDNLSPQDIANKIKLLFHNPNLYQELVEKGKKQLVKFDRSHEQTQKYLNICKSILKN